MMDSLISTVTKLIMGIHFLDDKATNSDDELVGDDNKTDYNNNKPIGHGENPIDIDQELADDRNGPKINGHEVPREDYEELPYANNSEYNQHELTTKTRLKHNSDLNTHKVNRSQISTAELMSDKSDTTLIYNTARKRNSQGS